MKTNKIIIILLLTLAAFTTKAQVKTYPVNGFNKVIISPHVEVVLKQGDTEQVEVNDIFLPIEKLNVEIEGKNTLRVYLDGAKMVTKSEKVDEKARKWEGKRQSIYKGTQVKVTITYKTLETLSVRGEEQIMFQDALEQDELTLRVYGQSRIYLNDVQLGKLKTTIYGESFVEAKQGKIEKQQFTAYGSSSINTEAIQNTETKVTAYGESSFKLNVSGQLKVSAYGESTITYKGPANLKKGIVIGDSKIIHLN